MTLLHVLKAIGFDAEDLESVWRVDPADRLEERQASLRRLLAQRYAALVRRRRLIEKLKDRIERDEKCLVQSSTRGQVEGKASFEQRIRNRIERSVRLLRHHEHIYCTQLKKTLRMRQKLDLLGKDLAAHH